MSARKKAQCPHGPRANENASREQSTGGAEGQITGSGNPARLRDFETASLSGQATIANARDRRQSEAKIATERIRSIVFFFVLLLSSTSITRFPLVLGDEYPSYVPLISLATHRSANLKCVL